MGVLLALALGMGAGLNPYVTAAIVAVVAMESRYFQPNQVVGFVATPAFLIVALALLPLDLFADKFPRSGGLMDRVSWLIRPATGAMLGGAAMADGAALAALGIVLGLAAAAGSHALRLRIRRRLQWRLLGFGRIVLGAYGDLSSGVVAVVALLAPPAGFTLAAALLGLAVWADRRWGLDAPSPAPPRRAAG